MANIINGKFTLKECLQLTYESKQFNNRFDFKDRDTLKSIIIKKVNNLKFDRPKEPTVTYIIESSSYPTYRPYYTVRDKRGKLRKYQRTTKHTYEVVLNMDRLTLNTKCWRARVGSNAVWEKNPPKHLIKSISSEERKKIYSRVESNNKGKTKKYIQEKYMEEISKRQKSGLYLDTGDYNASVKKINGDFYWRLMYTYQVNGHLYGINSTNGLPSYKSNPNQICFVPKHLIRVIEILLKRGILKDN